MTTENRATLYTPDSIKAMDSDELLQCAKDIIGADYISLVDEEHFRLWATELHETNSATNSSQPDCFFDSLEIPF